MYILPYLSGSILISFESFQRPIKIRFLFLPIIELGPKIPILYALSC